MMRNPSLLAGGLIITLLMIAAAFGPLAIRVDPLSINLGLSLAGPSARHWLGCDSLGRDMLARVLWGARLSLGVSTVVVALSLAVGSIIGGAAALAGGRIDNLVMRGVDIVLAFPGFLLAIALAAILGPGLTDLVIALTAMGWTGFARLVRGEVLSLREREYVEAARALGASPPRLLLPAGDGMPGAAPRRVMDPAAAFIVADILADNGARVPTFGLDNALATRYWSAVKTGTSKDMRDNWCIGFSARYTVGVWVGNASGAPMHAVSGVTGAAPVWRQVMDALQRSDGAWAHPGRLGPAHAVAVSVRTPPMQATPPAPGEPVPPPGLVARSIDFAGHLEAPRTEWFLAGTETAHVALASAAGTAARLIASPDDRSVVALDPDIPPAVQRLRFEAVDPPPPGAAWRLDGRRLGPARPLPWSPWPGHHLLELVDAQGGVLDAVAFDVRGARARPVVPAGKKPARRGAGAS